MLFSYVSLPAKNTFETNIYSGFSVSSMASLMQLSLQQIRFKRLEMQLKHSFRKMINTEKQFKKGLC